MNNAAAALTTARIFRFSCIAASCIERVPRTPVLCRDRRIPTQLLDGDAPRSDRRSRQRRRTEDQPKTLCRCRDREGHSWQGQRPVTHVYCGGASEGGAPVPRNEPIADL